MGPFQELGQCEARHFQGRPTPLTHSASAGAKITFELPTPATHPALAEIEAFRAKTGGKPVTYIVADVDNRNGTELVNMYRVNAFDKEGREYTFSTVTDALDMWQPQTIYGSGGKYRLPDGRVLDDVTGTALYNEGVDLNNANNNDADVAERATLILASTDVDLPNEFTRVSVHPSGGLREAEEARPSP